MRRWLPVALAIVVLGWGLWQRFRPRSYDEALAVLLDGTPDRAERLAMLEIVASGSASDIQLARGDIARLVLKRGVKLGAETLRVAAQATDQELRELALDEPALEGLLRGHAALARGNRELARVAFAQAEASGRLYELDGVVQLAREQLALLK